MYKVSYYSLHSKCSPCPPPKRTYIHTLKCSCVCLHSLTLVMTAAEMPSKGLIDRMTRVSFHPLIKPMMKPVKKVLRDWINVPTLSAMPSFILKMSLRREQGVIQIFVLQKSFSKKTDLPFLNYVKVLESSALIQNRLKSHYKGFNQLTALPLPFPSQAQNRTYKTSDSCSVLTLSCFFCTI